MLPFRKYKIFQFVSFEPNEPETWTVIAETEEKAIALFFEQVLNSKRSAICNYLFNEPGQKFVRIYNAAKWHNGRRDFHIYTHELEVNKIF